MPAPAYSANASSAFNLYTDANISPPSYQESLMETKNLVDEPQKGDIIESDDASFKPLYPYFKDFTI